MSDNCWKRARKQTYEKLHKHKMKEELDMSKDDQKYSVKHEEKTPGSEMPKIILTGLIEDGIDLKNLTRISHDNKIYKINRIECMAPVYFHCTTEDGKYTIVQIQKDGTYNFLNFD